MYNTKIVRLHENPREYVLYFYINNNYVPVQRIGADSLDDALDKFKSDIENRFKDINYEQ